MKLPEQFKEENIENIRIYHYVEELVVSYKSHMEPLIEETGISLTECPFFIRIGFSENSNQQELAEMFNVSEGYTAKLLRKFEDKELISRREDPNNRRKKIVTLTEKGIQKMEEIMSLVDQWEEKVSRNISDDDYKIVKNALFKMVNEQ
ncbi:MarR family transcriptional regulator [Methanosphaera sp. ISO3-F5]|uniref:MarR family winged helix-turn-helix transcriptional regulator n=1 Tax=Methanosphaera sp. ISO3-F5 TaxID=1452353 RepID=UPI002B2622F4|nr:MarR family transcriptional regulator [Methanosphaera sp. ISO3-F5]WQH63575.1 MarR family transcriptional regulator [Methanosphaera sp. ISO3-F5]